MTPYDINNIPQELGTYALVLKREPQSHTLRHCIAELRHNSLLHRNDFYSANSISINVPTIIPPCLIESYIKLDE